MTGPNVCRESGGGCRWCHKTLWVCPATRVFNNTRRKIRQLSIRSCTPSFHFGEVIWSDSITHQHLCRLTITALSCNYGRRICHRSLHNHLCSLQSASKWQVLQHRKKTLDYKIDEYKTEKMRPWWRFQLSVVEGLIFYKCCSDLPLRTSSEFSGNDVTSGCYI